MDVKSFIDFLSDKVIENISDSNLSRRRDAERWVYTTNVNVLLPKYPRVHVFEVSAPRSAREVNSDRRRVESRVQMSVLWSLQDRHGLNGFVSQPERGLYDLVMRLESFVNHNQELWRGFGVLSVKSIDVRDVQSGKRDVLRKDIDFLVVWDTEAYDES